MGIYMFRLLFGGETNKIIKNIMKCYRGKEVKQKEEEAIIIFEEGGMGRVFSWEETVSLSGTCNSKHSHA
jgi:hypothetical protein